MTGDLGSSLAYRNLTCRRFDLSTPAMIFGGLFLAATAIRGLDAAPALSTDFEEVKVLAEQPTMFTAGPNDILMMGCQSERSMTGMSLKLKRLTERCKAAKDVH